MAQESHGTVTVVFDDFLALPEQAGKLSDSEVASIARSPRGMRQVGEETADALEKAGASVVLSKDLTPERVRTACQRAERIDGVVTDLEVLLVKFKQANLLMDEEAWKVLRQVNDLVNAQIKHNPELEPMFKPLREFMRRRRGRSRKSSKGEK